MATYKDDMYSVYMQTPTHRDSCTHTSRHPRRPRSSQWGGEKRWDESFQVRAKEPPGTDSHRTISKNSSGCRLLIGYKKCFVLLCPIGEKFLLSSFREFVHDGYYSVRSPSLCVQGKLLFSTFLTRNEGTTDESKKRLGCYQREQFNLPREYSVFDGSQCIVNNRKFKMRRRRGSQISNSLIRQSNNFARASCFFVLFSARLSVKMPNFTFCEGLKQEMTKFILFMNLDMVDRNSAPEEFACM